MFVPTVLVDVGNTRTDWCMEYDDEPGEFSPPEHISTQALLDRRAGFPDSWRFSRVIVASVVPQIDVQLQKSQLLELKLVTRQDYPQIKLGVDHPDEVGIDRIINVAAAREIAKKLPLVVVDFGTATTFDVLDASSTYLGGVIAPGIGLSRDILNERTAKLPKIEIFRPVHVIGHNTVDAMASGLIRAYEAMVEGMLLQIEKELGTSAELVLTGGYTELVKLERPSRIIPYLCFEGLKQLCR